MQADEHRCSVRGSTAMAITPRRCRAWRFPAGVVGIFAPTNVDLILAMCQFRSGNAAAGRQTYRLAVGRLNGDMQRLDTLPNAINLSDFMICQCLKREADAMFSGRPTSVPRRRRIRSSLDGRGSGRAFREGEAPAEPDLSNALRLGRSLALPFCHSCDGRFHCARLPRIIPTFKKSTYNRTSHA